MLRVCSKEEFLRYADFVWELAQDLTRSGYHTYCDRIKTREDFMERRLAAFDREAEEILLFEQEGKVQGVIHYYWIPEDHYLQTICFNTNTAAEQALAEFLGWIGGRFPGYDVYLGFPAENRAAVTWLAGQGFECIEDDYNNTAFPDQCPAAEISSGIVRITRENYDLFRALHTQDGDEIYWTADRILEHLDEWIILVKEDAGEPLGAIYYKALRKEGWYEIFGMIIPHGEYNPELVKELTNSVLADIKQRGGRYVTFFCGKEYEEAVKECGFLCIGNYLCYKTRLK